MLALEQSLEYLRTLGCSTSYATGSSAVSPHIAVSIPWCNRQLQWQILFSRGRLAGSAPDVVFEDDSSSNHPFSPLVDSWPRCQDVQLRQQKSEGSKALRQLLQGWSSDTSAAGLQLKQLVQLLLQLFRLHQKARLLEACSNIPRLLFELSTLPHAEGLELLLAEGARDTETKVRPA